MKHVINGLMYDTAKADCVCSWGAVGVSHDGGIYPDMQAEFKLYRTQAGRFFVTSLVWEQHGPQLKVLSDKFFGADSLDIYYVEDGKYRDAIATVTVDQAKLIVTKYGDADDYIEAFGDPEAA